MRAFAALAAFAACGIAGCSGDLPSVSVIDKLRLLAVSAEPPEAAPGQEVALDALVVEPLVQQIDGGPTATPSAFWLACSSPPNATGTETPCAIPPLDAGGVALPPDCAASPGAPVCLIGARSGASLGARYTAPALGPGSSGTVLITVAVSDDADGALGCLYSASQNGGVPAHADRCVIAVKRLAVADPARPGAAPPNHNPRLDALLLEDAAGDAGFAPDDDDQLATRDSDGAVAGLDGGAAYPPAPPGAKNPPKLRLAVRRADDAELEPTFDASGAQSGTRYELLTVSWFTTAGSIDSSRSVFVPPGCDAPAACPGLAPELDAGALWTPPTGGGLAAAPDGLVDFWAVLRDDRGGVSWLAGRARPHF